MCLHRFCPSSQHFVGTTTTQLTSHVHNFPLAHEISRGSRIILFHTSRRAFSSTGPLQSFPRGVGPDLWLRLEYWCFEESGFEPLRTMRCRAHLFVSTKL